MESLINEDFLLGNGYARELYHESAEKQPIIDYHCHLVPQQVAENHRFADITEVWLGGDHYKWRALRGNGVGEDFITGNRSSWEKFEKWAETVPYTMRNPLYHWTHLELARVFGIYDILKPETARSIYDRCNEMLGTEEFRAQALMRKFNVETVCTTDDPTDSLEWHKQIAEHPFGVQVLPTWRPDKVMGVDAPESFATYIGKLSEVSGVGITGYQDLLDALRKRHEFFARMGCRLSDHGLDTFYSDDCPREEADRIFRKVLGGQVPDAAEVSKFKSAVLFDLAAMDCESGWTQQFHVVLTETTTAGCSRNSARTRVSTPLTTNRLRLPVTDSSAISPTKINSERPYSTTSTRRIRRSLRLWHIPSMTEACLGRCSMAQPGGFSIRRTVCASR